MISVYARTALFGGLLLVAVNTVPCAEDQPDQPLGEFAVVLNVVSRLVETDQQVLWDQTNSKITLPGVPVRLKLVGANLMVVMQFTLYREKNGRMLLLTQGQIVVDIPNQGMSYHTTIETIPLQFGEQIYFFPLGQANPPEEPRIEVQVTLEPYTPETALPETVSGDPSAQAAEEQQ